MVAGIEELREYVKKLTFLTHAVAHAVLPVPPSFTACQ
jgi:hypothetical protein